MKLILTMIKDTVAEDCQRAVTPYENNATAKRAFGNGIVYILKNGNPENIPVSDLELWKVGEIDTETMEITPCKEFIAAGAQFVVNYVPTQPVAPKPVTIPDVVEENKGE